jgi:flavin-dependent dehydrogenase
VSGSTIRPAGDRDGELSDIRSRFVVACDGAASRFAAPAGVVRDDTRPLGIAARRYYRTDYHPGPWLESWLDLWEGDLLLPGYGWLFPVAGGTINLGAGLLNTFKDFKAVSAQRLFDAFASMLPPSYGVTEETAMSLQPPQAVPACSSRRCRWRGQL